MVNKVAVLTLFLLISSSMSANDHDHETQDHDHETPDHDHETQDHEEEHKTWCVAKPLADKEILEANIEFACSKVDCKFLEKSCPCASPDNLFNHASLAMNLYYQCKGRNKWNCDFKESALLTETDPSSGDCKYIYE